MGCIIRLFGMVGWDGMECIIRLFGVMGWDGIYLKVIWYDGMR